MSAFLCSSEHISRIVNASEPRELMRSPDAGMSDAEYTFAVLVAENRASLMARYETDDSDYELEYRRKRPSDDFAKPIAIIKLIQSYSYQSCEHDGWEASEAHRWVASLEHGLLMKIPGYEQAEWAV
jgi:hypothetical protein